MKPTLLFKFTVCYLLIFLTSLTVLNAYGIRRVEENLIQNKRIVLENEAKLICSEYLTRYYRGNLTLWNLDSQLQTIDTFVDARIWIVSRDGEILSDTRPAFRNQSFNIMKYDPDFINRDFDSYVQIPLLVDDPMMSVVSPVTISFELKGYIVLLFSLDNIKKESIYFIDTINMCFLFISLIFMAALIYLYIITFFPLKRNILAAREFSAGHFEYCLKAGGHDEFKDLTDAISYIAGELNSMDEYQKKFVANISHDFRSPLTSIRGYAEAMIDGTIPPELHEKYLGTILFESERLTKLTSNLLELNNFDNSKNRLDITAFDINHIIKKTAESFEGTCRSKRITINLLFSDAEAYVEADMGKIQQVLYNLIDNAIKFSHSDSSISISTDEKGGRIFISVKDFGTGIPKESIKRIWERFYKIDASRGKDKKGTGLGLSIVKEIITAHNEHINVISTEGVGTEFIFSLPKIID